MRRRFGVVIGLDLDNDPADAVDQQGRPDQLGRDQVDAAVKEGLADALGRPGGGAGLRRLRVVS